MNNKPEPRPVPNQKPEPLPGQGIPNTDNPATAKPDNPFK